MEMSVSCLRIAETGIGAVHVIIAILGLHHRWVVHIGKIPFRAVLPARKRTIIVGIGGSRPSDFLLLNGSECHIAGVDVGGSGLSIGTHMIGGAGLERRERHTDVLGRCRELVVVDGRVGGSAIAHATALDIRSGGRSRDHSRRRSDRGNHGSGNFHAGSWSSASATTFCTIVIVAAARHQQQAHA